MILPRYRNEKVVMVIFQISVFFGSYTTLPFLPFTKILILTHTF